MPARRTTSPSRWTSNCCWRCCACGWSARASARRPLRRNAEPPLDVSVSHPPLPTSSSRSRPTEPPPPAERARILIVDDDERNLLAIRTVLEDVADIVMARSGEEALRHLL